MSIPKKVVPARVVANELKRELKLQDEQVAQLKADLAKQLKEKEMGKTQIDLLANYIMAKIPGEPSTSEGAGDTAIRLLKQFKIDFDKFAGHTAECELNIPSPPGYTQKELDATVTFILHSLANSNDTAVAKVTGLVPRPKRCDCGLLEAQERGK